MKYSELPKILNAVETLLLGACCFGCNAHLYRGESLLCAFCRHELPLTDYNFGSENPVDRIFYGRNRFEKASSMLFYEENSCVQALLHQLKYRGQQHIGDFLGRWYAALLKEDHALPQMDWVFPVPLHRRKIRKRGFNQCSRFGMHLAVELGARYSEQILIRPDYGQTQTRLDRWARWESSRDAFALRNPEKIAGCRILLVDDVITTGATLEACCRTLNAAPEVKIYLASMAVVR